MWDCLNIRQSLYRQVTLSLSLLIAFPLRFFAKAAANYFYLCKNIGENDDFVVTYAMPIDGNDDKINVIENEFDYGTYGSWKSIDRLVEAIKGKQRLSGRSNADAGRKRGSGEGYANMGVRQSSNGRRSGRKNDGDVLLFRDGEAEPFYSNAERAVENIKQNKATPVKERLQKLRT